MPHHPKHLGRALRGAIGVENQLQLVDEDGFDPEPAPLNPSYCCVPMGCPRQKTEPIDPDNPGDAVRVLCNNENCDMGNWMHAECFEQWEQHVLAFLRSCGRARSWSEKQRMQNLWTKKGYDLAFKVCDCRCGRGHIRKDLNYIPQAKSVDARPKKHKKKPMERSMPNLSKSYVMPHNPVNIAAIGSGRPQLRIRTSSFSSTGSSPPSSAGTPPLTPSNAKSKFDFFTDAAQAASGNIFRKRTDFSVFNVLPRYLQNPYQIKMEDEGPHGNDETRCFVLTNLSTHQVTSVRCAACLVELPVFDKYPLIDGTFFLSPQSYHSELQVLFQHKMLHLNAVCMRCLTGHGREIRCKACHTQWLGAMLVIGTMYSYDIFAAMPCCAQRLACKNCHQTILDPGCTFQFFSEYSKVLQCPHCKAEDYHFIKPIKDVFNIRQSIC